jgi:hypothetical protein
MQKKILEAIGELGNEFQDCKQGTLEAYEKLTARQSRMENHVAMLTFSQTHSQGI